MSLLQVTGLGIELGGRTILDQIESKIEVGGIHLFIGPNGAGKSTLLKCMLGLMRPDRGSVLFEGRDIHRLPSRQRARLIAYVPQFLDLQFNMEVRSFMELSRYAHDDEPVSTRTALIEASLARTGTQHLIDAFLDQLSGGERQRVMIAAALAQQPQLLVLDEPNHSLDPEHRVGLVQLLAELYAEGSLTIVMVTHDWNEFVHLEPQVHGLKAGRLVFDCAARELPNHLDRLFDCGFHHLDIDGFPYSLPRYLR